MPEIDLVTLDRVQADASHDYLFVKDVDGMPMYRRVRSDGELEQVLREEWVEVLCRLWVAFDKPLDADRLKIYRDALSVLPFGLLEAGVNRAVREHRFNSVPTIAEVWDAVRKELGNPADLDRVIYSWSESLWQKAVYVFHEQSSDVSVEVSDDVLLASADAVA